MRRTAVLAAALALVAVPTVWPQGDDPASAPIAVGLDHVPVAVADLAAAAERYQRLGFTLKPGRPHENGIENRHAKFRDGTEIELITAREARDPLTAGAVRRLPDGTLIRLRHDGRYLFLAIATARQGFPSVCVARGDTIRIFHASAALGSVVYTRSAQEWVTGETKFVYGMRNTALDAEARAERDDYRARHGWLANTLRMSDGRAYELQISLAAAPERSRLAIAFYVPGGDTGSVLAWPESPAPGDGCFDEKLVRGYVPAALRFAPEEWPVLTLDP